MKKIGREVLFIKKQDGNPRNGEGAFIRLKNGDIMFGYTEFIGNDWEDDAHAQLAALFSSDEIAIFLYAVSPMPVTQPSIFRF